MNLYQRLGFLVLGSRLRRLSDSFLSEITRVYQQQGIEFEAGWFPVFYLLSEKGSLSIKELSEQTEVSHPAASQLITNLKNKGLVKTTASDDDARKQLVTLTDKGTELLEHIKPVWQSILSAMDELTTANHDCDNFLPAISALESAFQQHSLSDRVQDHLTEKSAAHE